MRGFNSKWLQNWIWHIKSGQTSWQVKLPFISSLGLAVQPDRHTWKTKTALTRTPSQRGLGERTRRGGDNDGRKMTQHKALLSVPTGCSATLSQHTLASQVFQEGMSAEEGGHATDNASSRQQEVLNNPQDDSGSQQSITSSIHW